MLVRAGGLDGVGHQLAHHHLHRAQVGVDHRVMPANQAVTDVAGRGAMPTSAATDRFRSVRATLTGDPGRAEPESSPVALGSLTVTSALCPDVLQPGPRPIGSTRSCRLGAD